jgi:hypothetical protein
MSLGSERLPRRPVSATVSSGKPRAASANPAMRRRIVRPRVGVIRARPRLTSSWVTRCTSMLPDSAAVVTPTPREKIWAMRPRRLAPRTSWVALTPRAKSSSAVGMSLPTTWW